MFKENKMFQKTQKNNEKEKNKKRPFYHPLSYKEMFRVYHKIRPYGKIIQTQFALFYLTGARLNEISQLTKNNFFYSTDSLGREMLIVQMPTLKNRKEKYRNLPLVKEEPYTKMIKNIETTLEFIEDYQSPIGNLTADGYEKRFQKLPKFKTEAILNKGYVPKNVKVIEKNKRDKNKAVVERKWFPHFFRHCRLTHLVEYHNFDATRLMFWAGWTDTRLARTYIHLDWNSLAILIQKGQVPMNY